MLAYYQASQIMPFVASDTTFEEMRSAGDLGLIADQDLRKELADYYRLEESSSALGALLRQNPVAGQRFAGSRPGPFSHTSGATASGSPVTTNKDSSPALRRSAKAGPRPFWPPIGNPRR